MNRPEQNATGGPGGRRGRWRSGIQSRQKILEAARGRFAAEGYERATVRAIATDAGVDPAMIHYFFGSKDELFATAMRMPASPRQPLADLFNRGLDDLGPHLVRGFLEAWDAAAEAEPLLVLALSARTHEPSAAMLREFIDQEFTAQIAKRLNTSDARLRAGLIGSQLLGLAVARYTVRVEPVASASHDTLVAWLGPVLQNLLTGSAPSMPRSS